MAPSTDPPAEQTAETATTTTATTTPETTAAAAAAPADRETLLSLIRRHGGSILAYSKLQPGLEHFYVPGLGAVSYCVMQVGPPFLFKNRPACLGDPLCADGDRAALTRLFLREHPRAFFVQVSRAYALLLSREFSLRATCMGGEAELDVGGGYDLSGAAKHALRNAAAAAEREGVYVRELACAGGDGAGGSPTFHHNSNNNSSESNDDDDDGSDHHRQEEDDDDDDERDPGVQRALRAVDAAWARTKGEHHAARIWFINRAPVFGVHEPGVRKFVAWQRRPDTGASASASTSGGEGGAAAPFDKKGGAAAPSQKKGEAAAPSEKEKTRAKRKMVAYVFFDPVYKDGRLAGAYANVTRLDPSAPPGCLNLIVREALAKFRGELEREAAALAAAAAAAERGDAPAAAADHGGDDGGDDLLPASDQQQPPQPQPQMLSRKERMALKAAALAARGLSAEELRAQRAAKRAAGDAPASSGPAAAARSPAKAAATAAAAAAAALVAASSDKPRLPPFFVSLGMAPFYALSAPEDDELPGEPSATRVMGWLFEHGQTFYPYKAIAFSKTRYGGGLDEATRTFPRDPHARWRPVYAASSLDAPTFVALFDLGALVGFWKGPFDAIATFVRYEWAGVRRKLAARFKAGGGGGGGGGCKGGGGSGGGDDADARPRPAAAAPVVKAAPPSSAFASAASAPISAPGGGGGGGGGGDSSPEGGCDGGGGGPVDAVFSFSSEDSPPPAGRGKLLDAAIAPRSDACPALDVRRAAPGLLIG